MRKKYADKRDINNILTATYKKIDINDDPHFVAASLVDIYEVQEKLTTTRKDGREDTLIDVAYKWVTLYLKDENYSIEVAINAKSEIVEFFFDIFKKVNYKSYIPSSSDLYVDVAITSRREIEFVGEDKLEEAYKMGELSRNNYELARRTADKIVNRYSKEDDFRKLINDAQKYLARLIACVESKEINRKGMDIEGFRDFFGQGDVSDKEMAKMEKIEKEKKKFSISGIISSILGKKGNTENAENLDNPNNQEEPKKDEGLEIPGGIPSENEPKKDEEEHIKENSIS